jgi:hypothetical protein
LVNTRKPSMHRHCAKTRARSTRAQGHFVRNRTVRISAKAQFTGDACPPGWPAQISGKRGTKGAQAQWPSGLRGWQQGDWLHHREGGESRVGIASRLPQTGSPLWVRQFLSAWHRMGPPRAASRPGAAAALRGAAAYAEPLSRGFNGRLSAGLPGGPSRSAPPIGPSGRRSPVGDWWSA